MSKGSAYQAKYDLVMAEFEAGRLKTSAGKKVTDARQAAAIAHSEARAHTQQKRKMSRGR